MTLTRSQMDAELQKLYDQIPAIPDCDGRCWTSCGPVGMSDRERQRIRQAGYKITPYEQAMARIDTFWCEALTEGKRCAVYELRPMICRLWGAVEGLPCVYGCVPEGGRRLSDAEGYWLIAESRRIGGSADGLPPATVEKISEVMAREHIRAELERIRSRGQPGDRRRMTEGVPAAFRRESGRAR
jgi:Fe-S-cluster containining protein